MAPLATAYLTPLRRSVTSTAAITVPAVTDGRVQAGPASPSAARAVASALRASVMWRAFKLVIPLVRVGSVNDAPARPASERTALIARPGPHE